VVRGASCHHHVDVGEDHTCVLVVDSTAMSSDGRGRVAPFCFGDAARGALGNNVTDGRFGLSTPAAQSPLFMLPDGVGAVSVSTGNYHTCVVTTTAEVYCAGDNQFGAIGNGESGVFPIPQKALVGVDVVDVVCTYSHTLALTVDGGVRMWGPNSQGWFGYYSFASASFIGNSFGLAITTVGDVEVGIIAVAVSATDSATCAMSQYGKLRCWGRGKALGYGTGLDVGVSEPPADAGDVPLPYPVSEFSVGNAHVCALAASATMDQLYCWGDGLYGQLGYGDVNAIGNGVGLNLTDIPPVPLGLDDNEQILEISASGSSTCVLLSTHRVRCWGYGLNYYGYGVTTNIGASANEPIEKYGDISGIEKVVAVAHGKGHTCAIVDESLAAGATTTTATTVSASDLALRCWGSQTSAIGADVDVSPTHVYTGDSAVTVSVSFPLASCRFAERYTPMMMPSAAPPTPVDVATSTVARAATTTVAPTASIGATTGTGGDIVSAPAPADAVPLLPALIAVLAALVVVVLLLVCLVAVFCFVRNKSAKQKQERLRSAPLRAMADDAGPESTYGNLTLVDHTAGASSLPHSTFASEDMQMERDGVAEYSAVPVGTGSSAASPEYTQVNFNTGGASGVSGGGGASSGYGGMPTSAFVTGEGGGGDGYAQVGFGTTGDMYTSPLPDDALAAGGAVQYATANVDAASTPPPDTYDSVPQ